MEQMRFIVEPSDNTFSSYRVVIKWSMFDGTRWRSVSFTNWLAAIKFLQANNVDDFSMVVHSELL